MAPDLQERASARNRRQRAHAHEMRRRAALHRYVTQAGAKQKIRRSRERLGKQVVRSKRMALRAKQKAVHAGNEHGGSECL